MAAVRGLPRPERGYLVCATPRSGSTLLCQALIESGVAGCPEEYFEARRSTRAPRSPREYLAGLADEVVEQLDSSPPPAPDYSSLRGVNGYRDHLRSVLERGTTANGVFAAKLMWMHVEDFLAWTATVPELGGRDLASTLTSLLPGLDYVWVRRRDDVSQAVSLWRAVQTQAWRAEEDSGSERSPEYSFAAIQCLLENLRADDLAWGEYFGEQSAATLELFYEDVAADLPGAVASVLERIGVDSGDAPPPQPLMKRQADEISESWVERYREDASEPVARAV
jgi:LPS sulfotransferase NodH